MAEGVKIGSGVVDITADMTNFDNAMNALPKKAAYKLDDAMKALQTKMAQTKLDLKIAVTQAAVTGDTAAVVRLTGLQEQLANKMNLVSAVATRQARAIQDAARAATREHLLQSAALDMLGAKGNQAGEQIKHGGMSGAMGLMMIAQMADDAQYGFRALVNQIPTAGMALGSVLGITTEAATKFGAIAGIAAVAINYIINHWDQFFEKFGYGTDTMKAMWASMFGEAEKGAESALDRIEARIKELQAKPVKLAIDMFELDQAIKKLKEGQAALRAWEGFGSGRGTFEKESGEKVQKIFTGLDADDQRKVKSDLRAKMIEEKSANLPENENLLKAQAKLREMKESNANNSILNPMRFTNFDVSVQEKRVQKAQEAANEEAKGMKEQIAREGGEADVELAKTWEEAIKGNKEAQKTLAKRLKDAGHDALAEKVASAAPGKVKPGFASAQEQRDQEELEQKGRENARAFAAKQREETKALNEQGREIERNMLEQRAADRDREAGRLAGALQPRLSGDIIKPGGINDADLEAKVKTALEQAGVAAEDIGKLVKETAAKLRRDVEERIKEKQFGGLTRNEAEKQVAKEDVEKRRALKGGKQAEITSTEDYLNKILVNSLSTAKEDTVPKDQLATQKEMVTRLDKVIQAVKDNKAAAGPAIIGRARR